MPLGLQAALQLGCVATVAPAARTRPLGEGFDLDELQVGGRVEGGGGRWGAGQGTEGRLKGGGGTRHKPRPSPRPRQPLNPDPSNHRLHPPPQRPQYADTTRCGYLEGDGPEGLGPLRYVALYHSADAGRGRGVYCLLLPATGRGLLVVAQPSALAQREVTPAALERAWRDGLGVLMPQGHNTQEQVRARGGSGGALAQGSSPVRRGALILHAPNPVLPPQAAPPAPAARPAPPGGHAVARGVGGRLLLRRHRGRAHPAARHPGCVARRGAGGQALALCVASPCPRLSAKPWPAGRGPSHACSPPLLAPPPSPPAYREVQRGPVLVAVQCPGGAARLQADVPLLGEFPCITVPALSEDSR
jgi:hypothetical protein